MLVLVPVVLALGLVWLPEISHFSAPQVRVPAPLVEAARQNPDDAVLHELREFSVLPIDGRTSELELSVAETMLRGRLELPEYPAGPLSLPFSQDDFDRLPAGLQLPYAAWVVPDFLLAAYVQTGREPFFAAARAFIGDWDQFERRSWLPKGFLWNDHAIAARVRVLAEFWRVYRTHPDYEPEIGRAILEQAARYGYFLSSPEHFTVSTNHGLIQNLGLLQISLSFPELPDRASYHQVALHRLGEQMQFLIDEGGVVQENSAGYQVFDLNLLGMTFRCMTLLGDRVPAVWAQRYTDGIHYLEHLLRPDGTLPAIGDTDGAPVVDLLRVTEIDAMGRTSPLHDFEAQPPERAETLYPDTGYWIRWVGLEGWPGGEDLSQTVVTWAVPPAPGHKHADEMSLLLWSDETSWLTSVGYWPYGDGGRTRAESWDGSNAPHIEGEQSTSERTTTLLGEGRSDSVAVLDLERSGPADYLARRQVISVSPDVWIVLDMVDASGVTTTTWTMSSEVDLRSTAVTGSYELVSLAGRGSASIHFRGSPQTTLETYRGSSDPFAGWHVVNRTPEPAPAIVVEQPAGPAWLVTAISTTGDPTGAALAVSGLDVDHIASAEAWAVTLGSGLDQLSIERSGDRLVVTRFDPTEEPTSTVRVAQPPSRAVEARVAAAFEAAARNYPIHLSWSTRREALTVLIPALFAGQELVLFVVRRRWPRWSLALRVVGLVGWIAVGVGLTALVIPSPRLLV